MRARRTTARAWMLLSAATPVIALLGLVAMLGGSAYAGVALEQRKLPMKFSWVDCQPNCRGWVSAVGIVTADTPRHFDDFARDRQLNGETVVLDSSGGSVNDSIALGRRFRELTVGVSVLAHSARGERPRVAGGLLRVHVRFCAAVGQVALRTGTGACPRASDLDGRPR